MVQKAAVAKLSRSASATTADLALLGRQHLATAKGELQIQSDETPHDNCPLFCNLPITKQWKV
jgi:hypothetical protein